MGCGVGECMYLLYGRSRMVPELAQYSTAGEREWFAKNLRSDVPCASNKMMNTAILEHYEYNLHDSSNDGHPGKGCIVSMVYDGTGRLHTPTNGPLSVLFSVAPSF